MARFLAMVPHPSHPPTAAGADWPTHGYVCENIQGKVFNSTPNPGCFTEVQRREDLYL